MDNFSGSQYLSIGMELSNTVLWLDEFLVSQDEQLFITVLPEVHISLRGGSGYTDINFYCGAGSKVEYLCDQFPSTQKKLTLDWYLEARSNVTCMIAGQATHDVSLACNLYLQGPGARAVLYGAMVLQAETKVQLATSQYHGCASATSQVTVHTIIGSGAFLEYQGLIDVAQCATETQASQVLKSMLISDSGKVRAIPTLQVRNNAVSCSHGAAVATIDMHHSYYLQARGISAQQARQLLVQGFLHDVCPEGSGPLVDSAQQIVTQATLSLF